MLICIERLREKLQDQNCFNISRYSSYHPEPKRNVQYHNTKIIPFRIIPVFITNQNDRATG